MSRMLWNFSGRRGNQAKLRKIGQLFPCLGDADTHAPHMCQFPTGEGL